MASRQTTMMELSAQDRECLSGHEGPALKHSMSLLCSVAAASGARRLVDVTQAHLVGAYYGGKADLKLVERIVATGARVAVPTTLNASSVDLRQPERYTQKEAEFRNSCRIVRLYERLGCRLELTCAPYHLPQQPQRGERVAWAESNAVVYANSVIGARTEKVYQYLDLCAALTGRIPEYGLYITENRRAKVLLRIADIPNRWLSEDSFYQLLGLVLGKLYDGRVIAVVGIPVDATEDQLRGLGAAAACTGNVSLFHAIGRTPEAPTQDAAFHGHPPEEVLSIDSSAIREVRDSLSHTTTNTVNAVALGAPHFSHAEFKRLAELLDGRRIHSSMRCFVSTSRHTYREITANGVMAVLESAGVQVLTDTCTYYGSLLRSHDAAVMTSSAKWAYYAPGNLGVSVRFERIEDCVATAVAGKLSVDEGFWGA
ncbi:MAG: aconitase X catalytic domain-containing protein [Pseudomonadota bacterium]